MVTERNIVAWAEEQARSLLSPLGDRWIHTKGVVERAQAIGKAFDEADRELLIAAAYLHDIGYAPSLKRTNFHPLDGAYYLFSQHQERLASIIAYHFEAQCEAQQRGLAAELNKIPREYSPVADALSYCDLTTGPTGQHISFEERLTDIFQRYDENNIVHVATRQAIPSLTRLVERMQAMLSKRERQPALIGEHH